MSKVDDVDGVYSVQTPYLTKDIWYNIFGKYPEMCPIRLVQFLRMNSVVTEEGDYNELYHLSNCRCRQEDHRWKYLVGDRITPSILHGIELCDILAIKESEVYYLHAKHKFDATAARNLCSQVRVGIRCVWGSLINLTKDCMIEKFYDAVSSLESRRPQDLPTKISTHEKLTLSELNGISLSKEKYFESLLGENTSHYVCLAPLLSEKSSFEKIRLCNLSYRFKEEDFDTDVQGRTNPFEIIVKAGILRENGKIAAQFFNIQNDEDFVARIKNNLKDQANQDESQLQVNKAQMIEVRKTIKKKLHIDDALLSTGTFVAKNEFSELHEHFTKYNRVHGSKDPIKLRIIELKRTKNIVHKSKNKDSNEKKRISTSNRDGSAKMKKVKKI